MGVAVASEGRAASFWEGFGGVGRGPAGVGRFPPGRFAPGRGAGVGREVSMGWFTVGAPGVATGFAGASDSLGAAGFGAAGRATGLAAGLAGAVGLGAFGVGTAF